MPAYELLIGLRYTRAKRRNNFISFISASSMAGIALGVAALIVVLSVMNGFQRELRDRILSVASHIEISAFDGALNDWQGVERAAQHVPHVLASAPYVVGQGMLVYDSAVRATLVRGIDPARESSVVDIASKMKSGRLDQLRPGEFGIVLGAEIARALGVGVGDQVTLVTPQGQISVAGLLPRLKTFRVVGVFEIGMFEFDSGLALINIADAQKLFQLGDAVTGVRLKLDDLFTAPEVAREISLALPPEVLVRDWTRSHANFFRAVQIEKRVMFIILALIVAVAAFNIVSTLVMVVTDKHADIAILRTLGASPASIQAIFVIQGSLIGIIGTLLGVTGGIVLALNIGTVVPFIEHLFHTQFLDRSVYYISELPSDLQRGDVLRIGLMSLVLSLTATLYPSWRAAKVNPADALRYE